MQIFVLTLLAVWAYADVTVTTYYSDNTCTTATSEFAANSAGTCIPGVCTSSNGFSSKKISCPGSSYTPTSGFIGYTSYSGNSCNSANLMAGFFGKPNVCSTTGSKSASL